MIPWRVRRGLRWLTLASRAMLSQRLISDSIDGFGTVTVTTYEPRQWSALLTLDAVSRGKVRPKRVVMFLDRPHYDAARLPLPIAALVRRGVTVFMLDRDDGSYKKLPLFAWTPPDPYEAVITIDDDVLYPADWLAGLRDAASTFDDDVLFYRGRTIRRDHLGNFLPYTEWPLITHDNSRLDVLPTGVGGVLYRRTALQAIAEKGTGFRELAPNADDLWFRLCTIERNIKARQIAPTAANFPITPFSEENALLVENMADGGNDSKLARIAPLFRLESLYGESTLPATECPPS